MSRTDHHRPWQIRAADRTEVKGNDPAYLDHKGEWSMSHSTLMTVPKWYVDHLWNNPERVRERDTFRRMANEYNTHGDLADGDFECRRPRNNAKWGWF